MREQVDEIKRKIDIVNLIGEHVKLTKAGKHYKGLCPFHAEKTPSFTVSPEMQIYKCFGCGESGDAFTFLEKYEGMEFVEALQFLADRAGVKLRKVQKDPNQINRERLIAINELSAKFYHYLLTQHPLGKKALLYVMGERGIAKDTIDQFLIGFAPENPKMLVNFLKRKKFSAEELVKAGVAFKTDTGEYIDRFRGRIIFPLFDHRGNCIALAGRIVPPAKKELAKYINSPETAIYHKSATLFGLNLTRGFIKKANWAIIVEGELDMISSWQVGVKNIVAIKGSALTEEQVSLLSRLCSKITLALDSDLAGNAAARRGISIAQSKGMTVEVMKPHEKYKDPDEWARAEAETYKKALNNGIGVWDFIINSVISKFDIDTGEGKAQASRELVPLIATISDEILKSHYMQLLAQKLKVSTDAVAQEISKNTKQTQVVVPFTKSKKEVPKPSSREELLQKNLFIFSFGQDPKILLDSKYDSYITQPLLIKIRSELKSFLENNEKFNVATFKEQLSAELVSGFEELVLSFNEDEFTPTQLGKEIEKTYQEMVLLTTRRQLLSLTERITELEEKGESEELTKAEREFAKLTEIIAKLRT